MSIFLLPLNSTLNPFLYTLNEVLEHRKQARFERLLERTKANGLSALLASDKHLLLGQIKQYLQAGKVSYSDIFASFDTKDKVIELIFTFIGEKTCAQTSTYLKA